MREYRNIGLKRFNSFGIEAYAARMIEFTDAADLISTLRNDTSILCGKWDVLGGGNNILLTCDYEGTLLHPVDKSVEILRETDENVWVRVGAAADWDSFVEWSVDRGYWGIENLSLIPGFAGASPVQNIGAYGAEVKDVIESVEMVAVDTLKEVTLAGVHCGFGYRDSVFKHELAGKAIITAVNFKLSKIAAPNLSYKLLCEMVESSGDMSLSSIRQAVIDIRRSKLPDPEEVGNAGSFFKNPVIAACEADKIKERYPDMPAYPDKDSNKVKLSCGWIIERAGWKGRSLGPAAIWDNQALIVVNRGGASGQDILDLAAAVRSDVRAMFGVEIEMEVNCW